MENRSHALIAGVFTLLLVAAAVAAGLWLSRDRNTLLPYELVSANSVNGLSAQSVVRYQGVPVGKVLELKLNPQRPGEVRIRIGVNETTPVTQSTWGELSVRGVTGLSNVELRDDGKSVTPLASADGNPPVIPLRPGLFDRLEQRSNAILGNVETVTSQLNKMLTDANVQAFQTTLQNASALTATINTSAQRLAPVAERIGPLVASLEQATRDGSAMARDVGALSRTARATLERVNAANGPLSMATRSIEEISYAAARLNNDTLPAITRMADTVRQTARGASQTVQRLGDAPQSILFGPAPAQAGPGEPGFAGFRRQ